MILDRLMPEFDATRIEHRVVDGTLEEAYAAVRHADFVKAWKEKRSVGLLFSLRSVAEGVVAQVRGSRPTEVEEPASLRLADLEAQGEWMLLGEDPPREIAFGVIGRFWGGETFWRNSVDIEFAGFSEPGFARIGCNFSLRDYADGRTLVSYEARTQATDPDARSAFLRYWRLVSPFVGVVMRAQLGVVAEVGRTVPRG